MLQTHRLRRNRLSGLTIHLSRITAYDQQSIPTASANLHQSRFLGNPQTWHHSSSLHPHSVRLYPILHGYTDPYPQNILTMTGLAQTLPHLFPRYLMILSRISISQTVPLPRLIPAIVYFHSTLFSTMFLHFLFTNLQRCRNLLIYILFLIIPYSPFLPRLTLMMIFHLLLLVPSCVSLHYLLPPAQVQCYLPTFLWWTNFRTRSCFPRNPPNLQLYLRLSPSRS